MNARRKALDDFFNQLWQVGLWTLTIVLLLIWVGVIMKMPLTSPLNEPIEQPAAAAY